MKFLFTSARMFGYWDGKRQHELAEGNCYGLTWNEDAAWLGRNRAGAQSEVVSVDGEPLPSPAMNNAHDMLWARGKLWIANTGRDLVVWWDGKRWGGYFFGCSEVNSLHLNSLWEWAGRVCVMASGLLGESGVQIFDVEDGELLVDLGIFLGHDFYVEDGWLYGCYKMLQETGMYRYCLETGEEEREPVEGGNWFMRGMARGDGFFLFGRSIDVERPLRRDGHSAVLVTDDDLNVTDEVMLRDTGQIRAVRLAEGDLAHNGLPYPGELP